MFSISIQVIHRVALGEGISWMRSGRIRKLMEDECYRIVAMKQLRKSIDPKSVAADHVPDIVRSFLIMINLCSNLNLYYCTESKNMTRLTV